jgi:hypothetical protein
VQLANRAIDSRMRHLVLAPPQYLIGVERSKIRQFAWLSGECQVFDVSESRPSLHNQATQPGRTHDRSKIETAAGLDPRAPRGTDGLERSKHPMPNISPITADEEKAIQYVKGVKEFYSHVFMYLIFVAAFGFFMGFKHPLILWGSIGWGIGLVVHGLNVFEVINIFGPNWEKKQIEKRLGRPL